MQSLIQDDATSRSFAGLVLSPPPTRNEMLDMLLQRERARADRLNAALTVLVISAARPQQTREFCRIMPQVAKARLRMTDEAAWSADHRLFIILPHTDAHGAAVVTRDVIAKSESFNVEALAETYCYPPHGESGHSPRNGDRSRNHPGSGPSGLQRRGEDRLTGALGPARELPEVASLDSMFVRPMPTWKRLMDIILALVGLVLTAPIIGLAAVVIRLTSPGPVLYRQRRGGAGGVPFTIFKLRTMIVDAEKLQAALEHLNEQGGPAFKIAADPRITPVGRFLRKTSIDELPQLWNVLKGDMSIVGPRPLPVDQMAACDRWHRRRLDVTPGITCTWQATARSTVTFDEWARMDARYSRNCSFWGDVAIILRTIPAVLLQHGAK